MRGNCHQRTTIMSRRQSLSVVLVAVYLLTGIFVEVIHEDVSTYWVGHGNRAARNCGDPVRDHSDGQQHQCPACIYSCQNASTPPSLTPLAVFAIVHTFNPARLERCAYGLSSFALPLKRGPPTV